MLGLAGIILALVGLVAGWVAGWVAGTVTGLLQLGALAQLVLNGAVSILVINLVGEHRDRIG